MKKQSCHCIKTIQKLFTNKNKEFFMSNGQKVENKKRVYIKQNPKIYLLILKKVVSLYQLIFLHL